MRRVAPSRTAQPLVRCPCRALALNAEGSLLLSGSSDHTLRLWDLGQQRCLHTFAVHTDSVWAIQADPAFGVVYSGGRDKCVYRWVLGWGGRSRAG